MSTPHNEAKVGDIAEFVIMPGDPLRAEFIAKNFLTNPVCFNRVRGMLGFTGEFEGKRVSVMGSGMGFPSMGIYSYELFHFYNVKYIIRVGSCGSYIPDSHLGDVYMVNTSVTDSNWGENFANFKERSLPASEKINKALVESAKEQKIDVTPITVYSSDIFYRPGKLGEKMQEEENSKMRKNNIAAVDMESFALFCNAKFLNRDASCLLSVSDIFGTDKALSPKDRQESFTNMMRVALSSSKILL